MKTHFRECRRAKSAAIAAMFCAALALTSIAQGQITYVTSFGTLGSGNGQFNIPAGVAVGPTGQVYVADYENSRIDVFTNTGGIGTPPSFGSSGSGTGDIEFPIGVAVGSTGQVYVTDSLNTRIDVFTSSGGTGNPASFGSLGSGNGQFSIPEGVAVGPTGQVYVADGNNFRIDVFTSTGGNGTPPSFGSYGSGTGQFGSANPMGVAVSPAGQVYAADPGNNRIDVFTSAGGNGTPASFATTSGSASGVAGVAVGPGTGDVYVVDQGNSSIDVYNSSGQYLTYFGSSGTGNGQFVKPTAVAVSPTGEIYVGDSYNFAYPFNNRIEKFFDLAEWVSGSPHFTTAAVGYGQLLGTSLTMNANQGLQVDGPLTIQPGGSLTTLGGNVTAGTLTNSGQYSVNGGTVTVNGGAGTLLNNTAMTLNGGTVVGSLTNYYGANLNAAGTVTGNLANLGTLTQSGLLSITGNVTNSAVMVLAGSGTITGGGSFANGPSGTIRGDGAVTMTLTNQGLIYANGSNGLTLSSLTYNSGTLRVADGDSLTVGAHYVSSFNNAFDISLTGPNAAFNGDPIYNTGTISGQGLITNSINPNDGTIRAVGGQLVLAGATIVNNAAGSIESAAGTSILVSIGLGSNNGIIALTGGSFDNNNNSLTNNGSVLGNGMFSTGGLYNSGIVTFSDGNSSIFGAVTNNSGGQLTTYGTSATVISFYGPVTNAVGSPAGYIKINGTTVRWLGGFTNNGTYISDPAANYFTGLAVGASGLLQGGAGDSFFVAGTFTNAGDIDLGGTSQMVVNNGSGTLVQTGGVLHLGTSATLAAGAVEINGGTLLADGPSASITASLVYDSPSASTYQGLLAGAGNSLTVDNPSALLVLGGCNTYGGGTFVEAGTLVITNNEGLADGASLTVGIPSMFPAPVVPSPTAGNRIAPVPEPGTLALFVAGGALMAILGRLRTRTARAMLL